MANAVPQFVTDIFDQMGCSLRGAFIYVGGHLPVYGTEPNPFLRFNVNGKRGAGWKITIEVDPSDTYNVWLADKTGTKLYEETDIYCDMLQSTVKKMYDQGINEHNQGFIPLD